MSIMVANGFSQPTSITLTGPGVLHARSRDGAVVEGYPIAHLPQGMRIFREVGVAYYYTFGLGVRGLIIRPQIILSPLVRIN